MLQLRISIQRGSYFQNQCLCLGEQLESMDRFEARTVHTYCPLWISAGSFSNEPISIDMLLLRSANTGSRFKNGGLSEAARFAWAPSKMSKVRRKLQGTGPRARHPTTGLNANQPPFQANQLAETITLF